LADVWRAPPGALFGIVLVTKGGCHAPCSGQCDRLGALSVIPLGLRAEASRGFRVVKVEANSTAAPTYGTPSCDAAGNCVVGYGINGQLSRGMQGTFVNDGTIYSDSGTYALSARHYSG
jgi:hypothetical protein